MTRFLAILFLFLPALALAAIGDPVPRRGAQTFSEEFNGGSLDWRRSYYMCSEAAICGRVLPPELQVYTDADWQRDVAPLVPCGVEPAKQSGGVLVITAGSFAGDDLKAACNRGLPVASYRNYSSGFLSTQGTFAQTYGYFEASIMYPKLCGAWGAFWMLPVAKTETNDGRTPEFDISETYSCDVYAPGTTHVVPRVGVAYQTIHPTDAPQIGFTSKFNVGAFNTYGMWWDAEKVVFYVNGRETGRTVNTGWHDPHYLVLNLALSTKAAGDFTGFPMQMRVSYVRVWGLP